MSSHRLLPALVAASLVLAACGGDDDSDDAAGVVADSAPEDADAEVENGADDDTDPGVDDDGDDAPLVEAGFGSFVSGTVTLAGAEEAEYTLDGSEYGFVGAGGCGGGQFGLTMQVVELATGYTVANLSAEIDEDLSGGGTGSFPVDNVVLLAVTDGDLASSRTYGGPGMLNVTAHDTGGVDANLDERRMELAIDGTLEATEAEGEMAVTADLVWVMGCP